MTRVLLVGDVHLSDRAPSSCTDSYTDDLFDLLGEVAKLERSLDADAVVFAGDVFHHKQPARTSHGLVLRTIDAFRKFANPWIVVGNHDISNDRLDSLAKQPLGVLLEAGIPELNGWHPTLPLYGVPWQQRWLAEGTAMDAFAGWREGRNSDYGAPDWNSGCLAVTHAPIFPPNTRDEQMFDLLPTAGAGGLSGAMGGQGFLYYGHIHEDHGWWTEEGVTYCNVGALSRGSLTEYNLNRTVKVAVWDDFEEKGDPFTRPTPDFSEIVLPQKPPSEVFRIAEVAETKQDRKNLDDFLSEVGSSTLSISSTESVIAHIRDRSDIPDRVRWKAIELLEEVG